MCVYLYMCLPWGSFVQEVGWDAGHTVFQEEVLVGVGIANGLNSLVHVHHVGAEDSDVVLAVVEQPFCAADLGGQTWSAP